MPFHCFFGVSWCFCPLFFWMTTPQAALSFFASSLSLLCSYHHPICSLRQVGATGWTNTTTRLKRIYSYWNFNQIKSICHFKANNGYEWRTSLVNIPRKFIHVLQSRDLTANDRRFENFKLLSHSRCQLIPTQVVANEIHQTSEVRDHWQLHQLLALLIALLIALVSCVAREQNHKARITGWLNRESLKFVSCLDLLTSFHNSFYCP